MAIISNKMLLRPPNFFGFTLIIYLCLILKANCVHSEALDTEYEYGDPNISYDMLSYDDSGQEATREMAQAVMSKESLDTALPLCCPRGEVFDHVKCILPPTSFDWVPKLDGAPSALLAFNGFPKCEVKKNLIQLYQKEVHFNLEEAMAFLPYYIHLHKVPKKDYCVTKVYDPSDPTCEDFQTKIFTCFDEQKEPAGIMWTSVSISHIFIVLTLLAYFCVSELRCLQGQYMICFLISLLIYDLCLLPGSALPMDISDVSCIALGAVKYFFFCGVFLWFNTICFDIWRTLRNKQDVSGRRRFLIYSLYSWTVGALLTTAVLVMPYVKDDVGDESREDPLKDSNYDTCKLKLQMNMILQIAQFVSLILDLILLIMATCCVCSYSKFGNGLPRCEASLCLKQGWKLFVIMFVHVINCIDEDITGMKFPVPLWCYMLLESAAIFGVFAYRRTIIRKIFRKKVCQSQCAMKPEEQSLQEKGHLTVLA